MEKPRLKGLFHVSDTREGCDYTVGMIDGFESSGEILGANQGNIILDRKHFSFLVHAIDRAYLNAAGGYAESIVLDILEFLYKGW